MAKLKPSIDKTQLQQQNISSNEKLKIIGQAIQEETKIVETKKKKSNNFKLINFKISEEKKEEYEKFFGGEGFSLSSAIRMCLDYVVIQTRAGKLQISDSGIHENILNGLK